MTDKQIIIDNVDVSGCEFYIDSKNLEFNCKQTPQSYFCKNQPNCYYKQLKRKEQECEMLKKKLKPKLKNAHCAYFDWQTGWCKAKEFTRCNPIGCKLYTIDELSTIVDLQRQLDQLKAEFDKKELIFAGVETSNRLLIEKNNKLKQTLTEIKEIAEAESYLSPQSTRLLVHKILQKISECEDNQ